VEQRKVGFIGAGNMATSIIAGLLEQGQPARCIHASDPDPVRLNSLAAQAPVLVTTDNSAVAGETDVLILAVKPQMMAEAVASIRPAIAGRPVVVISIAAGITVASLERQLGSGTAIVRCMPNTPALLREGASALYANAATAQSQRDTAAAILGAVGTVCWLEDEAQMDAVTAISGSGPAYFFLLMEAMVAAGEKLGLGADTTHRLVVQTALGAARMAAESEVDLAELRRRVTSPGGTTEAALSKLEAAAFSDVVDAAVRAATDRSRQLAAEMG
jgi:pyrroline-5-carboxylate reductase